jgi:hypothetical protein
MPAIQHEKCEHQKCKAKMQRIFKRDHSSFHTCWLDLSLCGLLKVDDEQRPDIRGHRIPNNSIALWWFLKKDGDIGVGLVPDGLSDKPL